jgi:hypothetical protein
MSNIEKLGFDSWFKDKIDLSKPDNFTIIRVISVSKKTQWLGWVAQYGQLPGTSVTKTILNIYYYVFCGCFVSYKVLIGLK